MNNKGNIMLNFLFFIMALIIVIMFIGPINTFLGFAQNSQNLNCYGYVYNGNPNHPLSFNGSLNNNQSGSPIACLAISLYLPYLLLVFLLTGVAKLLTDRTDMFGMSGGIDQQGY